MSLNLCQFIGHLGSDPETRYTQDQTAVTTINIACSERWKDKNTGEKKERTEWIRAVAYGKQAEVIAQYFKKGSQIYISGRFQTRKYQDNNGQDRCSTDIRIDKFEFLDKANNQANNQGSTQKGQSSGQNNAQRQVAYSGNSGQSFDDFDDDIPF